MFYKEVHGKLLKLIGNYLEMHAGIEMPQIAFKRKKFGDFFHT